MNERNVFQYLDMYFEPFYIGVPYDEDVSQMPI
jgi:hypothetical protein